jgi:flagellar basal body-associated protein FliL
MSKRKKIVLVVLIALAVLFAGAVVFYVHFFMNAGQTIETLQKLVEGNGYEITADCTLTFEPSDKLKPVADLIQEILNTDSLTAEFTAAGESAQKNLKLQLKENMTEEQNALTTFYLVDGNCYFGIDSIISALAGDEIDKSFLLKIAYNGWIKDHCVTMEQLTNLIYDLTGVTVENPLKMPGGMDAVLFLIEPEHLFDPKLWSTVKVRNKTDGASEFTIDTDYFAQLVGIEPEQADANFSFWVDKEDNYTFTLTVTVSDGDGNQIQADVHATANKLVQQNTITAPELLLTDEQIDQLKDLAEPFIDSIKK